jgi:hypothetical protein
MQKRGKTLSYGTMVFFAPFGGRRKGKKYHSGICMGMWGEVLEAPAKSEAV